MGIKFFIILVLINCLCDCQRRSQSSTESFDYPISDNEDFTEIPNPKTTSKSQTVGTTDRKSNNSLPERSPTRLDIKPPKTAPPNEGLTQLIYAKGGLNLLFCPKDVHGHFLDQNYNFLNQNIFVSKLRQKFFPKN